MKTKTHTGRNAAIVAGVAIAGAAAAYFLTGKQGARNRKLVASWAVRAKRDALSRIKKLKSVNQASYNAALKAAVSRYKKMKGVSPEELRALERELRGHWTRVKKGVLRAAGAAKKKGTKKK